MTAMSFTLCAVDVTNSVPDTAVWWTCSDCGGEVELTGPDVERAVLPCPDCAGALHEMWRWERVAA